jgi:catalase
MLAGDADARDFVRLQYRHCKPMLAIGDGQQLLAAAGIPAALADGTPDPALWQVSAGALDSALSEFQQALGGHRNFQRETDAAPL